MDKNTFFNNANKTSTIEIDGQIYTFRKLKQGEVERMKREYATEDKALAGFRFVVASVLLDNDNGQMFKLEDTAKLADVDYAIIEGIAHAAMTFSGLIKPAKN